MTPPTSRRAGRAVGRWWRRNGPTVRQATGPARAAWAGVAAYGWFVGYLWIGLLLSVTGERLTGRTSPLLLLTAIGGGGALGVWQGRHRARRHADPSTPPMRGVGVAIAAWLGAVGLAIVFTMP